MEIMKCNCCGKELKIEQGIEKEDSAGGQRRKAKDLLAGQLQFVHR